MPMRGRLGAVGLAAIAGVLAGRPHEEANAPAGARLNRTNRLMPERGSPFGTTGLLCGVRL